MLSIANETFGDFNGKDVYRRHTHARSEGTVRDFHYTFSSGTPINTVAHVSSLNSGAGAFNIFVKGVTGSIDVDTSTPMVGVTTSLTQCNSTLFKANGALAIKDVTTTQNGTSLETQFPTSASVTDVKWLGTSNQTVARLDNEGNMQLSGSLQTNEDVVVSQDLSVAGSSTLYGAVSVVGDQTSNIAKTLFVGGDQSGIVVGPSLGSPLGQFLYDADASIAEQKAFQSTIPVVYAGSSLRSEIGTLGLVVSSTSNSANRTVLSDSSLAFNSKWRIRHDTTTDNLVVEYYNGTAWIFKSRLAV